MDGKILEIFRTVPQFKKNVGLLIFIKLKIFEVAKITWLTYEKFN